MSSSSHELLKNKDFVQWFAAYEGVEYDRLLANTNRDFVQGGYMASFTRQQHYANTLDIWRQNLCFGLDSDDWACIASVAPFVVDMSTKVGDCQALARFTSPSMLNILQKVLQKNDKLTLC